MEADGPVKVSHRYIFLTKGMVALVDQADFEHASQYRWKAHRGSGRRQAWYASTLVGGRRIYLHRHILQTRAPVIDHRNGDGLDNRRANFRCCTHRSNARNHPIRTDSTTGFKGVDYVKKLQKYRARILTRAGQRLHLGTFPFPDQAARAYDRAAKKHYGRYARLNFPR